MLTGVEEGEGCERDEGDIDGFLRDGGEAASATGAYRDWQEDKY